MGDNSTNRTNDVNKTKEPYPPRGRARETAFGTGVSPKETEGKTVVDNNNNNTAGEIEKELPKISPKISDLTPEEVATLTAKPVDSEPDRAKVTCKGEAHNG